MTKDSEIVKRAIQCPKFSSTKVRRIIKRKISMNIDTSDESDDVEVSEFASYFTWQHF